MNSWWETLAPRERILILTAAALTALVVLWQFILVPSLSANAEARARLADADRSGLHWLCSGCRGFDH